MQTDDHPGPIVVWFCTIVPLIPLLAVRKWIEYCTLSGAITLSADCISWMIIAQNIMQIISVGALPRDGHTVDCNTTVRRPSVSVCLSILAFQSTMEPNADRSKLTEIAHSSRNSWTTFEVRNWMVKVIARQGMLPEQMKGWFVLNANLVENIKYVEYYRRLSFKSRKSRSESRSMSNRAQSDS